VTTGTDGGTAAASGRDATETGAAGTGASGTDAAGTDGTGKPLELRVVAGRPNDEELAAVTAVLSAAVAAQPVRERDTARLDAHERHAGEVGVRLDHFVRDSRERAREAVSVQQDLLGGNRRRQRHSTPFRPHWTGLKGFGSENTNVSSGWCPPDGDGRFAAICRRTQLLLGRSRQTVHHGSPTMSSGSVIASIASWACSTEDSGTETVTESSSPSASSAAMRSRSDGHGRPP